MTQSQAIDQGINWCYPTLDNLRFMQAHYVTHAFAPHAHDYFVIGIVEDGVQQFKHGASYHVTIPGKLIIINPGEVHTGQAAARDGFTYRALYPSKTLIAQWSNTFKSSPAHLLLSSGVSDDAELFYRLRRLHQQSEKNAFSMELEGGFLNWFVDLMHRYALTPLELVSYKWAPQAVQQARDYIEAHYARQITLSELSNAVHITPYHLTRLFGKHIGIPPHRYLENVRIRHAEHLLQEGMPIVEVALRTGFAGQSHLTRTFKRFIGTTPGSFSQQRKIR